MKKPPRAFIGSWAISHLIPRVVVSLFLKDAIQSPSIFDAITFKQYNSLNLATKGKSCWADSKSGGKAVASSAWFLHHLTVMKVAT